MKIEGIPGEFALTTAQNPKNGAGFEFQRFIAPVSDEAVRAAPARERVQLKIQCPDGPAAAILQQFANRGKASPYILMTVVDRSGPRQTTSRVVFTDCVITSFTDWNRPRDSASGQSTGKRNYNPIKFTMVLTAAKVTVNNVTPKLDAPVRFLQSVADQTE